MRVRSVYVVFERGVQQTGTLSKLERAALGVDVSSSIETSLSVRSVRAWTSRT